MLGTEFDSTIECCKKNIKKKGGGGGVQDFSVHVYIHVDS